MLHVFLFSISHLTLKLLYFFQSYLQQMFICDLQSFTVIVFIVAAHTMIPEHLVKLELSLAKFLYAFFVFLTVR